jgi:hypothetical protein
MYGLPIRQQKLRGIAMAKKIKSKSPELEFEEAFDEIAGQDYPPIDDVFLKMIADGDVPLTDDLFFECLRESKNYLRTQPFRDKVVAWTLEGNRKMLNRIQTSLKPERRGRPPSKTGGSRKHQIAISYLKNLKLLDNFLMNHAGKSNSTKNAIFRALYPESKIDFRLHQTYQELAIILTCEQWGISERTMRKLRSTVPLLRT